MSALSHSALRAPSERTAAPSPVPLSGLQRRAQDLQEQYATHMQHEASAAVAVMTPRTPPPGSDAFSVFLIAGSGEVQSPTATNQTPRWLHTPSRSAARTLDVLGVGELQAENEPQVTPHGERHSTLEHLITVDALQVIALLSRCAAPSCAVRCERCCCMTSSADAWRWGQGCWSRNSSAPSCLQHYIMQPVS